MKSLTTYINESVVNEAARKAPEIFNTTFGRWVAWLTRMNHDSMFASSEIREMFDCDEDALRAFIKKNRNTKIELKENTYKLGGGRGATHRFTCDGKKFELHWLRARKGTKPEHGPKYDPDDDRYETPDDKQVPFQDWIKPEDKVDKCLDDIIAGKPLRDKWHRGVNYANKEAHKNSMEVGKWADESGWTARWRKEAGLDD